jgi:DNA-binding winged helix-turn-helix (wHTH) protein/tetratricopeptide (TPR) repeat protein
MLIKLGRWFLDNQTGILSLSITSQKEETKRLDHTPLALLLCLLKYRGQDVSKDIMLAEVWQNKVVSEDVLSVAMSQIRKALEDNARKPIYIKTIPGIGYRLIAEVEEIENFVNSEKPVEKTARNKKVTIGFVISICLVFLFFTFVNMKPAPMTTEQQLPSLSAKSHYQKGRYLLTQKDQKSWQEAQQIFEDTIISSPEFAPVYRELAQAKLKLLGRDNLAAFGKIKELKFLLNKTLSLSPNDQASYLLLANVAFNIEWDFALAEQHFIKALKIDDNNAKAHYRYSIFLMAAGKFELSLKHIQQYISLDPLGYAAPMVAWIYNMMEEYELAIGEMERLESLDSNDLMYLMSSQSILENTGQEQESFLKLVKIFQHSSYTEDEISSVTQAFEQGGLANVNLWLLETKKEQNNIGQGYPPLSLARYAVKAGKKNLAIKYIQQALEIRERNLLYFNVDPIYKSIRHAPELKNMIK